MTCLPLFIPISLTNRNLKKEKTKNSPVKFNCLTSGLVFKSVLDLALLKDRENPSSLDGSLGSALAWGDGDLWLNPG